MVFGGLVRVGQLLWSQQSPLIYVAKGHSSFLNHSETICGQWPQLFMVHYYNCMKSQYWLLCQDNSWLDLLVDIKFISDTEIVILFTAFNARITSDIYLIPLLHSGLLYLFYWSHFIWVGRLRPGPGWNMFPFLVGQE